MSHSLEMVCINLITRPDKRSFASHIFRVCGLDKNVVFYDAIPCDKGGRHGCFRSHISVIASAYERGVDHIIVFEDDVFPTLLYSKKRFDWCIDWVQKNKDIDMFFFGNYPFRSMNETIFPYLMAKHVKENPNLIYFVPVGFHSYCVSRSGMEKILNSTWKHAIEHEHFDVFVASLTNIKSICYVPCLFDQYSCSGSDNKPMHSLEAFLRNFKCMVDIFHWSYKISLFKFKLNVMMEYSLLYFVFCIIFIFAVWMCFVFI
jgi:hypothetical protein